MRNIKGYRQMLTESMQAGDEHSRLIYGVFAGDSNIYGVGFYGTRKQVEDAIEHRYMDEDRKWLKSVEDPYVFAIDPKDPKELGEALTLANGAEAAIGTEEEQLDDRETEVYLLRMLIALGVSVEDIIGIEHKRRFSSKKEALTLDDLIRIGLFDGDISWLPEGRIKDSIRRVKKTKGLFNR